MLSMEKRAEIFAHYSKSGSYKRTAEAFGVAVGTVKSIAQRQIEGHIDTESVLEFMDTREGKVKRIIDCYLDALLRPEKIEAASVNQLSTVLGSVIDRFARERGGKKSVSVSFNDIPEEWLR